MKRAWMWDPVTYGTIDGILKFIVNAKQTKVTKDVSPKDNSTAMSFPMASELAGPVSYIERRNEQRRRQDKGRNGDGNKATFFKFEKGSCERGEQCPYSHDGNGSTARGDDRRREGRFNQQRDHQRQGGRRDE